jgi:excisionase family DNA binding protein
MSETRSLSFAALLEILAEKLASRLTQEPSRLYPRLLTVDQAALYLGPAWEEVQRLTHSGTMPAVCVGGRVFLDRLDLDKWIDDNKTGWA